MPNFQAWDKHPIWIHTALHQLICEAAAQEGIDSTEMLSELIVIGFALRSTVRNYSLGNDPAMPQDPSIGSPDWGNACDRKNDPPG